MFPKIKTMDKMDWLIKHINHKLKESYIAEENYIIAVVQCLECNEYYIFDDISIMKAKVKGDGIIFGS